MCRANVSTELIRMEHSPPRGGGVDAPSIRWIRSETARPGWSVQQSCAGLNISPNRPLLRPRAVALALRARLGHFGGFATLTAAATPPFQGGEYCSLPIHSNVMTARISWIPGKRAVTVYGCALSRLRSADRAYNFHQAKTLQCPIADNPPEQTWSKTAHIKSNSFGKLDYRSEERRVGKECR